MDLSCVKKLIESVPDMSTALGIELVSTPESDECVAVMRVDERTRQPFGILSGGATMALAETLAGAGSVALCPDSICVGVSISGNHLKSVAEGGTVTAKAKLLSNSRRLHVWNVCITDTSGNIISTVNVTNYIKRQNTLSCNK